MSDLLARIGAGAVGARSIDLCNRAQGRRGEGTSRDFPWGSIAILSEPLAGGRNVVQGDDWILGWLPDGTKITFFTDFEGNMEIYVMDEDGGNIKNITNNPAMDAEASWSPDGKNMVFVSDRSGNHDIYIAELTEELTVANIRQVTSFSSREGHPFWQPVRDQK